MSVHGIGVLLGCSVQTRPAINKPVCGFCELPTILHWNFCSSFILKLGLMDFFFFFWQLCWKPCYSSCRLSPSRNMKANVWKNCCLKDEPCLPWKCVGVCWCPECHMPVHRGGDGPGPEMLCLWCWPAPRSCWNQCLPLPTTVQPYCCPHKSVNKVCALFMLKNIFDWGIITLQWCLGFCCTITWFSHKHICIPSILRLPPF